MWDAADCATLIDTDMPGYTLATKADLSTIGGLFRNGYGEAFGMVSGSSPSFFCVASGAPTEGQTLTIDAVVYTVTKFKPDSLGFARLELEAP